MANWQYLTNEEKKNHQLYKKQTAFKWFMIYLAFQCFLSFGSAAGAYAEYKSYLNQYSLNTTSPPSSFLIISLIPAIFIFLALILFKYYGKSKRTVILFTIFLITFPILNFLINSYLIVRYQLDGNEIIPKMIALVVWFIFFGIVFYIYSLKSKPFNLQYLNRIKS